MSIKHTFLGTRFKENKIIEPVVVKIAKKTNLFTEISVRACVSLTPTFARFFWLIGHAMSKLIYYMTDFGSVLL